MKIRTLLIDDESKALVTLKNKITTHCPELQIIGLIESPKDAIAEINRSKPDLVFMDIQMPGMTGFQLLSQLIDPPQFEIIFATASDRHAIDAIRHCAIGYLTKPINNEELCFAVKNAVQNIQRKNPFQKTQVLMENLLAKTGDQKLAIPTMDGYEFIRNGEIIRCQGEDGYTRVYFENRKSILSSYNIGYFKKLLEEKGFYLSHKSHLINLSHVTKYLHEGIVELTDNHAVPIARNRRDDFLVLLGKDRK